MTFSSLISGTIPHHGKFSARTGPVIRVIQHHWASFGGAGEAALASPTTKKSVNYLVYNDGVIKGQVPEEFRAWTSGSLAVDGVSITIEVQNQSGAPDWRVSDAAINSIARLLADIAHRKGFVSLNDGTYRGHREFAATACPGPYLWERMPAVRQMANAFRAGSNTSPTPAPVASKIVPYTEVDMTSFATEALTDAYYEECGRAPGNAELAPRRLRLAKGESTLKDEIVGIDKSVESNRWAVHQLYLELLKRGGGVSEWDGWIVATGNDIVKIRAGLTGSDEYKKLHP